MSAIPGTLAITPKSMLEGMTLPSGWTLVERLLPSSGATNYLLNWSNFVPTGHFRPVMHTINQGCCLDSTAPSTNLLPNLALLVHKIMTTIRVLLLGKPKHCGMGVVGEDFGTPISVPNGSGGRVNYHRAVFHLPSVNGSIDHAWYVYVTDEYQTSPGQLTSEEISRALADANIEAHFKDIQIGDLQHDRHLP